MIYSQLASTIANILNQIVEDHRKIQTRIVWNYLGYSSAANLNPKMSQWEFYR